MTKPEKCICGTYPEIKKESHVYGGGRYKGGTRSTWWEARCKTAFPGQCRCRGKGDTEEDAIKEWNERVRKVTERKNAEDKLLYDLEHSAYKNHAGEEGREHALGRLLRDVAWLKEQIIEMRKEAKQ